MFSAQGNHHLVAEDPQGLEFELSLLQDRIKIFGVWLDALRGWWVFQGAWFNV
jgi:hypothetical protein